MTFDLWETLIHDPLANVRRRSERRVERMCDVLRRARLDVTKSDVLAAYDGIWEHLRAGYWSRDVDPGFGFQLDWLAERLGLELGPSGLLRDLREAYVEPIFEVPPLLVGDVFRLLSRLNAMGFRLGIICNTSVTPGIALRRLLAGYGVERLVCAQVYSDELGWRKPAAPMFQRAAALLHVDPRQLLHVGDNPATDVQGALAAGAQALLTRIAGPDPGRLLTDSGSETGSSAEQVILELVSRRTGPPSAGQSPRSPGATSER